MMKLNGAIFPPTDITILKLRHFAVDIITKLTVIITNNCFFNNRDNICDIYPLPSLQKLQLRYLCVTLESKLSVATFIGYFRNKANR